MSSEIKLFMVNNQKFNANKSKVKLQSLQKLQDFTKFIKVGWKTAQNTHKAINKLEL